MYYNTILGTIIRSSEEVKVCTSELVFGIVGLIICKHYITAQNYMSTIYNYNTIHKTIRIYINADGYCPSRESGVFKKDNLRLRDKLLI